MSEDGDNDGEENREKYGIVGGKEAVDEVREATDGDASEDDDSDE